MNDHRNETGLNHSEIAGIVISSLHEVLAMASADSPGASTITEDTCLIGHEAALDSMGLVTLIVEVEQFLEEEYDVTLILADERAMSQKSSPFRSVRSLTDYIHGLIEERGRDARS
jgi:acyl carrier protein